MTDADEEKDDNKSPLSFVRDEIVGELLGPIIRELKDAKRNICRLLMEMAAAEGFNILVLDIIIFIRCSPNHAVRTDHRKLISMAWE